MSVVSVSTRAGAWRLPMLSITLALLCAALHASGASADRASTDGPPHDARYGPFGLFDHRSRYGQGWFPEPLRIDESDVDNELRLDWEHDEGKGTVSDTLNAEFEKSFGLVTLELEVPYVWGEEATGGTNPATGAAQRARFSGVGNVDAAIRAPFFQYVSHDGFFDSTTGAAFELGIPTNSPLSKNAEIVARLFDDLRLGEHFSVQANVAMSWLLGSKPEGGARTLEYGLVLGYAFDQEQHHLPSVDRLIPIVELVGETGLDLTNRGHNLLSATLGVRANLDAVGPVQPRLGVGYVLPIDKGARDDLSWGIVTSLVFEY